MRKVFFLWFNKPYAIMWDLYGSSHVFKRSERDPGEIFRFYVFHWALILKIFCNYPIDSILIPKVSSCGWTPDFVG